jgi:hypothetical protein
MWNRVITTILQFHACLMTFGVCDVHCLCVGRVEDRVCVGAEVLNCEPRLLPRTVSGLVDFVDRSKPPKQEV